MTSPHHVATKPQVPLDLLAKEFIKCCPFGMEKILDHFLLTSPWVPSMSSKD